MTISGKNVTPPTLKRPERERLELISDSALLEVIQLLQVKYIVTVGKYVEQRCKCILKDFNQWQVEVGSITHPSPINPAANKGDWIAMATEQLKDMRILSILECTAHP